MTAATAAVAVTLIAPAQAERGAPEPAGDAVAALRAEASTAQERLAAATAAYEGGAARLAAAQQEAAAARAAAGESQRRYEAAQRELAIFVDAIYRLPLPNDVLLMAVQVTEPDGLRTASDLEQVTDSPNALIKRTERERAAAAKAVAMATTLEAEAARQAADLDRQRQEIAAAAEQVVVRLTAEVERLSGGGGSRASQAQVWSCDGATLVEVGAWPNGLLPESTLCPLPQPGHQLRGDATVAFVRMNGAFRGAFGRDLCVVDAYRNLADQQRLWATRPAFAAVPGRSNHGWGLAVDLCGPESYGGTAEHVWLQQNSTRWGWVHPTWAKPTGTRPESWHWEYALG